MSGTRFLDLPDLPDKTHYDDPPATARKPKICAALETMIQMAEETRTAMAHGLAGHIGKIGTVTFAQPGGQFVLSVEVIDVRRVYNRLDYLVSVRDASDDDPNASCGQVWIDAARFNERRDD
jgi:hypothetical protein